MRQSYNVNSCNELFSALFYTVRFLLLQIVKELLVKESSEQTSEAIEGDCREDQLPEETRCRLEGLKCMARWLLGLKTDVLSAQKTFRMLNAFIVNKGDLLSQGRLSKAEMS